MVSGAARTATGALRPAFEALLAPARAAAGARTTAAMADIVDRKRGGEGRREAMEVSDRAERRKSCERTMNDVADVVESEKKRERERERRRRFTKLVSSPLLSSETRKRGEKKSYAPALPLAPLLLRRGGGRRPPRGRGVAHGRRSELRCCRRRRCCCCCVHVLPAPPSLHFRFLFPLRHPDRRPLLRCRRRRGRRGGPSRDRRPVRGRAQDSVSRC